MVTRCGNSTPKQFYVYVHRRATDGLVFYVGKGTGKRAWALNGRNKHWHNIVKKHGRTVEIVQSGMQEWWALEMEIDLISSYGRDNVCNMTDGGEGASGFTHSPETKKRLSEVNSNRVIPMDQRIAMSIYRKGKPNGHLGLKRTDQARANMSAAQRSSKNRPDISGDKNPAKRIDVRMKMMVKRPSISGSKNCHASPILCIETGVRFGSIVEANEWLRSIGKNGDTKQCARGLSKTAGGYTWRYAERKKAPEGGPED